MLAAPSPIPTSVVAPAGTKWESETAAVRALPD